MWWAGVMSLSTLSQCIFIPISASRVFICKDNSKVLSWWMTCRDQFFKISFFIVVDIEQNSVWSLSVCDSWILTYIQVITEKRLLWDVHYSWWNIWKKNTHIREKRETAVSGTIFCYSLPQLCQNFTNTNFITFCSQWCCWESDFNHLLLRSKLKVVFNWTDCFKHSQTVRHLITSLLKLNIH